METVPWLKSFETGNALIDTQHRELIDLFNETLTSMREGRGADADAACRKFRRRLETHRADEEAILRKAEFPRLEQHLASHAEARARLDQVFATCEEVCKNSRSSPCSPKLSSAMIDHFLHADLDFKSFLQVKGLASEND